MPLRTGIQKRGGRPPWDYEIQTYDDLLEAVEEHKKRVGSGVANRDGYHPKPRLTVIGIEGTPGEVL
jgi:hypothetical protein